MTFRSMTAIDKILKVIELNIHFHIIFINITLYKNREESPKENHFTTIYFMEKRLLITTDVLRCFFTMLLACNIKLDELNQQFLILLFNMYIDQSNQHLKRKSFMGVINSALIIFFKLKLYFAFAYHSQSIHHTDVILKVEKAPLFS